MVPAPTVSSCPLRTTVAQSRTWWWHGSAMASDSTSHIVP